MASRYPENDILILCDDIIIVLHVFSIIICIWFIVFQARMIARRNCTSSVDKGESGLNENSVKASSRIQFLVKILLVIFKIVLVILGFGALGFQLYHFVFSTMVKIKAFGLENCFMGELVPHVMSIVICIWFIVYKWKSLKTTIDYEVHK